MGFVYDFWDKVFWSEGKVITATVATYTLLGTLILGGVHHSAYALKRDISKEKYKVQIESNIQKSAELSKFTGRADDCNPTRKSVFCWNVWCWNWKGRIKPEFMSVTYNIDKDLYEKMFKYIDIKYSYGPDGKLIDAEYSTRKNLSLFGGAKADRAEYQILQELVEVTTQKVLNIQNYGANHDYAELCSSKNTNVLINSISKPSFDNDGTISFLINTMVETKVNNKYVLSHKTLKVTQEMTDEIKANPSLVYVNYIKNKNVNVSLIKSVQEKEIQPKYTFELPNDLTL